MWWLRENIAVTAAMIVLVLILWIVLKDTVMDVLLDLSVLLRRAG